MMPVHASVTTSTETARYGRSFLITASEARFEPSSLQRRTSRSAVMNMVRRAGFSLQKNA
jgi:hypothetical protein